jgi:hypothetical protein
VGVPGVFSGLACQSHDGVAVDADETFGLADAVALDRVFEDEDRLLRGPTGMGQQGTFTIGEARLARMSVEQSIAVILAMVRAVLTQSSVVRSRAS